jgi:hypothetical protein
MLCPCGPGVVPVLGTDGPLSTLCGMALHFIGPEKLNRVIEEAKKRQRKSERRYAISWLISIAAALSFVALAWLSYFK